MKINKSELQSALEKVRPGLANKELIEQSTSFAFMGDRVVTYNDEISISHPVKELNVTGAVKAQELYQFLNKVDKDEIEVEWEECQVKIKAGKSKAGLTLQEEIRLPIDEIGNIGEWENLPDGFMEGMRFCRSSCSKDMSNPVLTCLHVRQDGYVESSDGFRITRYTLNDALPINTFLIPVSSVVELIKYNIKQIAQGYGWIHFKTDEGTIFSCRIFQDNYPAIAHILDVSEGKEIALPQDMSNALDRAQVFAKADFSGDSLVAIYIADSKMTVSTESDSGWFEETIRIKYKDDPIQFKTNPIFLSEMLGKVRNCVIGKEKIKFDGENWVHIIGLIMEE